LLGAAGAVLGVAIIAGALVWRRNRHPARRKT
jgi:hypothetical protein